MKRLMIAKYLVAKIQNLNMNHESQPVKSNPESVPYSELFWQVGGLFVG